MGLFDSWFMSKEERERRRGEMITRIFPYGEEEQRTCALAVLQELFGSEKRYNDQEYLFGFITGKNEYVLKGEGDDGRAAAIAYLKRLGWKKDEQIRLLLAFIELESDLESLENYPRADDVKQKAGVD